MVMSMWRGALWFSHGWRHYTRQGFQQRQKHFNDEEMLEDLSGKVYLVTGSNSGLGYATAHHLASKGGRVYLLCRSRERGEEAKQTIVERTGNSDLHVEVVDVSEQSSLASFADRFLASGERCDVLINNAGVMLQEKGEPTGDGLDRTFATNTMGCFLLTKLLMPALEKSSPSRVVMVSSGGALTQKLDVEDLEFAKSKKWDGTLAYAQTKRAQIYLAELFAEKYKGNGVYFYSMHPGWADTPGVSSSMPQFYDKLKDRLRTAEQGADTINWLATARHINTEEMNGRLFEDRATVSPFIRWTATQSSKEDVEKLWQKLHEKADFSDEHREEWMEKRME